MLVSPYPKTSHWLLVVPALFLAVFLALPFGVIVYRGASIDAFVDSITNSNLQRVAWFTFWQTVISTVLTVVFALPVTYIVSRFRFRGRNALLALITAPFLLPTVVVGTSLLALLPQQLHYTAISIIAAHVLFNVAVVVRVVMPS
jgi:thiamine transport system permease protein